MEKPFPSVADAILGGDSRAVSVQREREGPGYHSASCRVYVDVDVLGLATSFNQLDYTGS